MAVPLKWTKEDEEWFVERQHELRKLIVEAKTDEERREYEERLIHLLLIGVE